MWKAIKNFFCGDYELVAELAGTNTIKSTGVVKPILYQCFYSKSKKKYKVFCIGFDGDCEQLDNPACFIYEAKQKGYNLPQ